MLSDFPLLTRHYLQNYNGYKCRVYNLVIQYTLAAIRAIQSKGVWKLTEKHTSLVMLSQQKNA